MTTRLASLQNTVKNLKPWASVSAPVSEDSLWSWPISLARIGGSSPHLVQSNFSTVPGWERSSVQQAAEGEGETQHHGLPVLLLPTGDGR